MKTIHAIEIAILIVLAVLQFSTHARVGKLNRAAGLIDVYGARMDASEIRETRPAPGTGCEMIELVLN